MIGSVSKYFSMTGWRLGWMLVPPQLRRALQRLSSNMTVCPPAISQYAAVAAFTDESKSELDGHVRRYAVNRDVLLRGLPEIGITDLAPADGAFYAYADVGHLTDDSTAWCRQVLAETGVALAPGIDFDTVTRCSYCAVFICGQHRRHRRGPGAAGSHVTCVAEIADRGELRVTRVRHSALLSKARRHHYTVTTATTPKGERRRRALVSAAAELLREGGFDAVRHRAVATRRGGPRSPRPYYTSDFRLRFDSPAQSNSRGRRTPPDRRRIREVTRPASRVRFHCSTWLVGDLLACGEEDPDPTSKLISRYTMLASAPAPATAGEAVAAARRLDDLLADLLRRSAGWRSRAGLTGPQAIVDGAAAGALCEMEPDPRRPPGARRSGPSTSSPAARPGGHGHRAVGVVGHRAVAVAP